MATKFYFHATSSAISGTLPTSEQSSLTADSNLFTGEDGTANRTMNTSVGASQANLTNTSTGDTNAHNYYIARWVSPLIYQARISAQTWTLEYGAKEANAAANFPVSGTSVAGRVNCYVWKPSDGTKTGTILDGNTNADCEEAGTSQSVINCTFAGSEVTGITPGDAVIIIELWAIVTQANSTARVQDIYYDGTTENSTSSEAAFLSTPEDLELSATANNMTLIHAGGRQASTANTTHYISIVGNTESMTTTEAQVQVPIRQAGTASRLGIRLSTNGVAATSTFRTRKNGANGGQTLSIGSTLTGWFEDLSGTDSISAGDKLNYQFVPGAATNTVTITVASVYFAATTSTDTVTVLGIGRAISDAPNNTTKYMALNGDGDRTTTEANVKARQNRHSTGKNLAVYISANARTSTTTLQTRKNANNGNCTVSVTSTSTGLFEDTSNTDTISQGDDYNFAFTTGAGSGESFTWTLIKIELVSAISCSQIVTCGSGGSTLNANTTNYYPFGGHVKDDTSETVVKRRIRTSKFKIFDTYVYITANTVSATSTLRIRRNGVNGNNAVSITSNTTGLFSVLDQRDNSGSNDEINYQMVTGATGTNLNVSVISSSWTPISDFIAGIAGESVSVSDSVARLYGSSRSLSETSISVSDSVARAVVNSRTLSEASISVSDAVARVIGYPRDIAESAISVSDSLARAVANSRTLSETAITVSDSVARVIAFSRSLSESVISVSDSVARTIAANRTLSEAAITVSDAVDRMVAFSRTLSESAISVSDSIVRAVTNSRTLTESAISVSDSVSRTLGYPRDLPESAISVSDSVARAVANSRSLSEAAISVSDAVARTYGANRSISETATSVSDSVARAVENTRVLPESVTVSDDVDAVVESVGNFQRDLDESVTVSDQLDRSVTNVRTLSEPSISVSDSVSRAVVFSRTLSEAAISVSDSVTRTLAFLRALPESTSVSDQLDRVYGAVKSLPESVSVSDSLARAVQNTRAIAEAAISVSDSLVRSFGTARSIVEDAISVSDSVDISQTFGIPTLVRKVRNWLFSKYEEDDPSKQ